MTKNIPSQAHGPDENDRCNQDRRVNKIALDYNKLYLEIQSSREFAENIVETVRDPLLVLDADLKILTANQSFYNAFKVTPEETIGNFIYDLGNRQWDIPALRVLLEQILPLNTVFNDYEIDHVFQSIGYRNILLNARQIFRKETGSHIILLAMEDVTDRKLAESTMEQLIHAQKMESIGELASGLAHDLNNILTVINGYATLLHMRHRDDDELNQDVNEIIQASSRAAILSRSLLAYSRTQVLMQTTQNLNDLIEIIGKFIRKIMLDNIEIEISVQDEPLLGYVDTVQIEQVLLNFANNARDAMPNGGSFSITLEAVDIDDGFALAQGHDQADSYAVITVTDTGHGMDEQTRLKVFDPFFTTKSVDKGTGLGLSIVAGIIKQHGGFIDLESEPGKGSVFRVYLPLVTGEEEEIAAVTDDEHYEPAEVSGATILVIEDDHDSRVVINEFLTRGGYKVITAVDGQDGVEKFAAHKDEIKLVISDVIMPRKSGPDACSEIKQMSSDVKCIFVSGHTSNIMEREKELGVDAEIVMKPILPFELLKRITELINPQESFRGNNRGYRYSGSRVPEESEAVVRRG